MNEHITTKWTDKIRLWGGWYRHLDVFYDGLKIGFIQEKRQNKRTTVITCPVFENSCVLGGDVDWLVKRAKELGKIEGA